jgi:signal transduction histidine kinase
MEEWMPVEASAGGNRGSGNTIMGTADIAAPLAREKQELVQQLRRTNEELNHFVRALSHDMRVNFFLLENSFSQLKRRLAPRQPDDVVQSMAHVEACLRQSQRFLEDLVELGHSGSVQLEPRAVDLARVVDEVLFEQRELLDERRVQVVVEGGLPTLWCNEGRLKQIVANLLRNAVKHGCNRRTPQVTIGPESAAGTTSDVADPPARRFAFRVHDNGRGIDPRHHQEIFLPGRRLADADAEGTGMGLAIVKKIVDYYGGSVYVDPSCAQGTAMVVALPAKSVELEKSARTAKAELPAGPHRPHSPQPYKKFTRRSSPSGRG